MSDSAEKQAHKRLLNAVLAFVGAEQNGSKSEIRETAIALDAATKHSQAVLYPTVTSNIK